MSCGCSSNPVNLTEAPASIASQLDALTAALFGTVTKLVVDGRVTWTSTCSASLPFIIAGVVPFEGEGLLCYLIRALKEIPGVVLPGILTFADEAARNATAPEFVGQIGSQRDTNKLYVATGIVAGNWDPAVGGTGTVVFANTAARAAAVPGFIGQFGSQTDTGEAYVATGLTAGDWILASAGSSGAFTQNNFTGTGAQTAFTLTQDPGSIVNTWVFVDGVYQNKTTAYGVSGTTLTFTEAPANGAEIQAIVGVMGVTSVVPDDLSVSTAKIQDEAVTTAQLASDAVETAKIKDASVTGDKLSTVAKTRSIFVDLGTIATTGTTTKNIPAPLAGTLIGARLVSTVNLAANDTNYLTFALVNKGQAAAGTTAMFSATDSGTTKATGGAAIAANVARALPLHATAGNATLVSDDVLVFTAAASGTLANTVTNAALRLDFTIAL